MSALFEGPAHLPQGVRRQSDGSVEFRVWAPHCETVNLVTWPAGERRQSRMETAPGGYHILRHQDVSDGLRYAYQVPSGQERPDPVSRSQPTSVHEPSAVVFLEDFAWTDQDWRGVPRENLVLYELHVGTFSPEGTFEGIVPRLESLLELGVTAIELMPLAQFPGNRNWGYDGVFPYAVQNSYGGPRGMQAFVNAAHRAGMGVFVDVVYNHLGPEGNYLGEFGPYFTDHYHTPWGQAINFDNRDCEAVRRFVLDNVEMWIRDYHVDGLRLDAVHAIYDFGARHILADIQDAAARAAREANRTVQVIAESHQNDSRLLDETARGGYGLAGVWSDDFHHAVHTLLTAEVDGYYADFGQGEHLAKAFRNGFVYDGCYSPYRRRRHGNSAAHLERDRLVICIQNHDQVGNRAQGDRFGTMLKPAAQRLAAALLLVAPDMPMLFMGEEYGEQRPFPFFCSFGDPGLIEAVRQGRRREFENLAFNWQIELPDPQAAATYESARLSWDWPSGSWQAGLRQLYADLLAARRSWPEFAARGSQQADPVQAEMVDTSALYIRRGRAAVLEVWANLGETAWTLPPASRSGREIRLSTSSSRYGGGRESTDALEELEPYELVVMTSEEAARE